MNDKDQSSARSTAFRQAIAAFIQERCEAKIKGLSDEQAATQTAKYDYHTWLADAARRVSQIQAVTHVLKATHPDARGSSLHVHPKTLPQHTDIGTHLLGDNYDDDIVGNAAALDVYKFLKVEVAERRLLDWLQDDDADLLAALNADESTAKEWATAFKGLIRPIDALTSHPMAKQLYWNVAGTATDDGNFHLVQPLFPSSLVHVVHTNINDARFGEANKEARQAYFKKAEHHTAYSNYRDLVIRKLGGTKPQNISQLNSERGGVNYLLASLPPSWDQSRARNFLFIESALDRFRYFEGVKELLTALTKLLKDNPSPTITTRNKREAIERALGQAFAAFGLASQQLFEAGWTRNSDCALPLCEQLWLDPERLALEVRPEHEEADNAFNQAYEQKDWPDEVGHRFGNWLNAILKKEGFLVGDAEHAHWAKQAIMDCQWPAPIQRRALASNNNKEMMHG
ncbi:MAG: type I-F CRISPR-associated protein Csy1 [Alcanivoracaceae bacterium]|nr:type I-F CRISPR-associated protein Csy1 [Alcanivoracaceae bacterium]